MKTLALMLQIGELFKGNYNRDGIYHLFMFIVMAAVVIGFGAVIVYKGFKKPKDK